MTELELAAIIKGIAPAIREHVTSRARSDNTERLGEIIVAGIRKAMAPHVARLDALEQRLAALEARPVVKDAGVWVSGRTYDAGAIVSFNGSGWICRTTHVSVGSEPSHDCFRLFVKHGRDAGRDAR